VRPAIPWWRDAHLVVAERLTRQLYWSVPALRRLRRRQGKAPSLQQCDRSELKAELQRLGVVTGALVMAHTRISGVQITEGGVSSGEASMTRSAALLLGDLLALVGSTGTLVMPTNPANQSDTESSTVTYDPRRTPCDVGLVNELFWRRKDVCRSRFPYNSLAARGPLADVLLHDNLNDRRPSPHGSDSGYFRFCERNGLVVSIGIPLSDCLTLAHVAEETHPAWSIKDFFAERVYHVVEDGKGRDWTVQVRRSEYAEFCYCRRKMARDLVHEGVIHEGRVGNVRVDWARGAEVFDFFVGKTRRGSYPYYAPWLVSRR
jgi:aminoglycoside N3'-acetyltransferase